MVTFRSNNNRRSSFRSNNSRRPSFRSNNDGPKFSNNDNFQRKVPGRNNHNASKLIEKYNDLAREALASEDKILSENYFQHADHFTRVQNEQEKIKMSRISSTRTETAKPITVKIEDEKPIIAKVEKETSIKNISERDVLKETTKNLEKKTEEKKSV
jgi:hypothetical protein